MLKVVSVLIAFTLTSNHAAAEGESVETEQDSTVVDLDAAEIEKAKQEELARKKTANSWLSTNYRCRPRNRCHLFRRNQR
jgi:hypothetical protein